MPPRKRNSQRSPRILVVTPEITYLPDGMGNMANSMTAKAGGLADVSSALVSSLLSLGADVHVALPHYRQMFHVDVGRLISDELRIYQTKLPDDRVHLAEDRAFYYRDTVYDDHSSENLRIALAFQREVINNIIPLVNPDLIHCNDWMTGLVPAAARRLNIPCLFTLHNIYTVKATLAEIEDRGIDAAQFWPYLYYAWPPGNYEETRATIPVDLLASGIFSSHFINTVSPTFLSEIVDGHHAFIPEHIRYEVAMKRNTGCAEGILNAPESAYNPTTDRALTYPYGPTTCVEGKRRNKREFQKRTGLRPDPDAPLFFWPSRLDPVQKGCQLLTEILFDLTSTYANDNIQFAIVANGAFQRHFHEIVRYHDLFGRVAVCNFDEALSHLGFAAADFMLMPSRFEPCGLPQMISTIYGALPIVRATGGLRDTVQHIDTSEETGNGFVFETYDSAGLWWAIKEAIHFHRLPPHIRAKHVARIMEQSAESFSHAVTAKHYFKIYERMLDRPLVSIF